MRKKIWVAVIVATCLLLIIPSAKTLISSISAPEITKNVELYYPVSLEIGEVLDNSSFVVTGHFSKFNKTWNLARNPENIKEEDPDYYIEGRIYEFIVDKSYKGLLDNNKRILINLPYSHDNVVDETYIEPVLKEDVVLFLNYDENFDYYYPALEPYCFTLNNDELTAKTNLKEVKDSFNKKDKKVKLLDIIDKE